MEGDGIRMGKRKEKKILKGWGKNSERMLERMAKGWGREW